MWASSSRGHNFAEKNRLPKVSRDNTEAASPCELGSSWGGEQSGSAASLGVARRPGPWPPPGREVQPTAARSTNGTQACRHRPAHDQVHAMSGCWWVFALVVSNPLLSTPSPPPPHCASPRVLTASALPASTLLATPRSAPSYPALQCPPPAKPPTTATPGSPCSAAMTPATRCIRGCAHHPRDRKMGQTGHRPTCRKGPR